MSSDTKELISNDPDSQKSDSFQASYNLFKVSVGVGVLSLPYYFNAAGYLLSTVIMVLITGMTFYSTLKIIELADLKGLKETNYEILYKSEVGKWAYLYFEIAMVIGYIGVCACYVITIIAFLKSLFGTDDTLSTLLYAFFSLCLILPLSFIRKFEFFVKYSFLANALMLSTFIFIYGYCFTNINTENLDNLADFSELVGIMGVFLFAFENPGQMLPIRNSMRNKEDFGRVFLLVNSLVLFLYISFSIMCGLGFSPQYLTSNILTGFGEINNLYLILGGLYALALIISYPIQLSPALEVMESISFVQVFLERNQENFWRRNSVRIIISFIIFPCGIFISNLADLVSLLGIFSGLVIQFVYPLWAYNIYMGDKLSAKVRFFHYFVILVSVVATISATYSSVLTLIQDFSS